MTYSVEDAVTEHPADVDLVAYADGELVDAEAQAIRSHVAACGRCAKVLDDLEPEIEPRSGDEASAPVPMPFALRELFSGAATADPAPLELWRAEWAGVALLVLVLEESEGQYRIIPATFEEPSTPVTAELPAAATSLGAALYLWYRLERSVPLGAFLAPVASISADALPERVEVAGTDAATVLHMTQLMAAVDVLTGADAPLRKGARAAPAATVEAVLRPFRPSVLASTTSLPLTSITALKRGDRQPTREEAELLAAVVGVTAEELSGPVSLPEALIRVVQRPVHRTSIRLRAAALQLSEAVMRLRVAESVAVLPARTARGAARDLQVWDELVQQYLDE